jgi:hypothetical protein
MASVIGDAEGYLSHREQVYRAYRRPPTQRCDFQRPKLGKEHRHPARFTAGKGKQR